jgi:methylmalonyl-CoA/ethylmalonyl-CoA epimerase
MPEFPLDHVGIAVPSLEQALPLWERLTGGAPYGRERVQAQGVEVVFVGRGEGRLELLAPLGPDSPVARHLERRGPGMHHLAYRVPDVDEALAAFIAEGYEAIDPRGRPGAHGRTVAFLHPRAAGGVLIELVSGG